MSGDTLSAIALRYLGDASRWTEIYDANESGIEVTAREHPGPPVFGTSDHGHWIFPATSLTIPGVACAPPTPQATAGVPADCAEPLIIGVRGSGESPAAIDTLTSEPNLGPYVGTISENLRPSGVQVYGLPYTAAAPTNLALDSAEQLAQRYIGQALANPGLAAGRLGADLAQNGVPIPDSVRDGAQQLQTDILTRVGHCSDQKIVLAGYSQGAWVIRMALDALSRRDDWPQIRETISGIGLLADPYNPWFHPSLPPDLVGRTLKLCHPEDPVCNDPLNTPNRDRCVPTFTILCPHVRYGTEALGTSGRTGVQQITDFLRRRLM